MNWSAGWLASWLVPYRNPSPTLLAALVTEPRLTVRDSAAAALCAGPSTGTGTVTAPNTAIAMAKRPTLALNFIGSPQPGDRARCERSHPRDSDCDRSHRRRQGITQAG